MQQIETDGISLKTELMEPNVNSHPLIFIEPSGAAPLASTSAQIITTSQPTVARPKILKRKLRLPLSNRKSKPTSIVARPTLRPTPTTPIPTTYLVVDGNQGRFVQVPNDAQQSVTFRNESGQILQATPINVLAPPTPIVPSITINGDCSLRSSVSNSSQTVTTVRTSSSVDLQQKTTVTGIFHPNLPTEVVRPVDPTCSLSLNQLAEKVHQRHRRSSSSSYSRKKRGRPRLYERDPFPSNSNRTVETSDVTLPTLNTSAVLLPTATTSATTQPFNSIVFPSTSIPLLSQPSLIQQHPYSYPSVLTNVVVSSPQSSLINLFPSKSEISSSSSNNEKIIHYIGGYVIRENRQTVSPKEKEKENSVLFQCQICQAMDIESRFFDCERRVCSRECLNILTQRKTIESIVENDEMTNLPADFGLPIDPTKWSVGQVADFIGRLTNSTIRDAFFECEMDGQALLLMTPEHLRDTMKIKLGPSLIISSEIGKLRERAAKSVVASI